MGTTRLGLPLAGWGVIYYVVAGSLLLLGWSLGKPFEAQARAGALLVSLAGAAASVALLIRMPAACRLCLAVHAVNFGRAAVLLRITGPGALPSTLLAALRYVVTGKAGDPAQARWTVLAFSSVALVGLVLYQWVFIQANLRSSGRSSSGHAEDLDNPQQVLSAFRSTPQQAIPVGSEDPAVGPSQAPVRLVLFSDFQCPACKSFSKRMPGLTKQFDGRLQVVFKHFPLDLNCNPVMKRELHPQGCAAAYAAEAARKQGRFWEFHDALFAADLRGGEETLRSVGRQIGLDLQQFDADRKAEATISKVRADIDLGMRLGVNSTPSTFWNGRNVRGLNSQVAQVLFAGESSP